MPLIDKQKVLYYHTREFQKKILAWFILSPESSARYLGTLVEPEFFENDMHSAICRAFTKLFLEIKSSVTSVSLVEEFLNQVSTSKTEEWTKAGVQEINSLFQTDLSDSKYIEHEVLKFAKYAAMRRAIMESAELINSPSEYAKVHEKIKEAMKMGANLNTAGHYLFRDSDMRMVTRQHRNDLASTIPTGFHSIDSVLMGGLSLGELGIILAPTSRGKTSLLVNLGVAALIHKKRCLHLTLELSAQKTADRYDMRLSGLTRGSLYQDDDGSAAKQLKSSLRRHSRFGGEVVILHAGAHTMTVDLLRVQFETLQSIDGFKPDMLIVDYGDLLKSGRMYGEKRHELAYIFEELRGFAGEHGMGCWTASQGNRISMAKEIVDLQDIAEDIGKVMIADVVVSICQTEEEKQQNKLRLFIAKARDSESRKTVNCVFDAERMRIKEVFD